MTTPTKTYYLNPYSNFSSTTELKQDGSFSSSSSSSSNSSSRSAQRRKLIQAASDDALSSISSLFEPFTPSTPFSSSPSSPCPIHFPVELLPTEINTIILSYVENLFYLLTKKIISPAIYSFIKEVQKKSQKPESFTPSIPLSSSSSPPCPNQAEEVRFPVKRLPTDLNKIILSYLEKDENLLDLVERKIISSATLTFIQKVQKESQKSAFKALSHFMSHQTSLNLQQIITYLRRETAIKSITERLIAPSWGHLRALDLSFCHLEYGLHPDTFPRIQQLCSKNLTFLSLKNWKLFFLKDEDKDKAISCLAKINFKHLTHLDLDNCDFDTNRVFENNESCLKHLNLANNPQVRGYHLMPFIGTAEQGKNLTFLDISGCKNFTKKTFSILARNCVNLTHLDIHDCLNTSREKPNLRGTDLIAIKSLSLSHLNISKNNIEMIPLDGERCKNLTFLDASWCQFPQDISFDFAAQCSKLTNLDLTCSENLTDRSFSIFAHNCPNLNYLSIGNCPLLTDVTLTLISTNLLKLIQLNINSVVSPFTDVGFESISQLKTSIIWPDDAREKWSQSEV